MKIQFNTDKNISGEERREEYFSNYISEQLDRFDSNISRIEVYLSDENGKKGGVNDIHCTIEARIEGRNPIAVSNQADAIHQAVFGAVEKLKASLNKVMGHIKSK